jgi:hypothetical protein
MCEERGTRCYYQRAANTKAAAVIHTRVSTMVVIAPEVFEEVLEGALLEEVAEEEVVTLTRPLVDEADREAEEDLVTDAEPEGTPLPEAGAGTAFEGSERAPIPHGMGSFEPG